MNEKHYYQIDNLYAIGTLLVILGHSHSSDWSLFAGTIWERIIEFIYTFHMPLFFFIAGFLFENSQSLIKNGYYLWIKNKAMKLLIPYIFLTVIAMVPKYYYENNGFAGISVQYILAVLLRPRDTVWGHFWFIPVLLIIYALVGIGKSIGRNINAKDYIIAIFTMALILYFVPYETPWFGFSDVKKELIFFSIGMFCAYRGLFSDDYETKKSVIAFTFFVGIACYINRYIGSLQIGHLLTGSFMIFAICELSIIISDNSLFRWISRHNYTIYIFSWPFQAMAMALLGAISDNWLFYSISMFAVGFAGPLVIIFIYKRFAFLQNGFFDLILGVK